MKKSELYEAAFIVMNSGYTSGACDAIYGITENLDLTDSAIDSFNKYFKPRGKIEFFDFWWGYPVKDESRLQRELALLIMAEIAKDEERDTK